MPSRILVVDDDATIGELIHEVLRSVDIESLVLTHSGQAATCLAREKFDAVFLDVHMPTPDGIELTRKIRSGGLNVSTPIMVITGEDDRALLGRAFGAGANFFLYKPIDRHDILRLVRATKDSIEHERRRFRRIKVSCKVSIESGGAQLNGATLDMSIGGMFVQSSGVLPVGTVALGTIHLSSGPPLHFAARILRVSGENCMGMQFENVSPAFSKGLQEFLLPLLLTKSDSR
ncbi:MAG TPA: response regulator [Candidatus Acidoferrales bacterium]|jgi:CheY-like chemotaxis protein|nr:response regulator [Candidatus Acidoferrales bacterium]